MADTPRATSARRAPVGSWHLRSSLALVSAAALLLLPAAAGAAPDAAAGKRLVQAHQCETCHSQKVYGPEGTIYLRKDRKVTSWAKLKAQVAACNAMLNVGLFPDEEEGIAAYLNSAYYKFRVD